MRNIIILLLHIIVSFKGLSQNKAPVDYVNVFTGTSNSRWMMFPGATVPFGMVKLSPDNQGNVWNGGYEYTVNSISGFSHLHSMSLSGVSVMPMTGKIEIYPGMYRLFPGAIDGPFGGMWTAGYRSRYDKSSEKGSPGYYSVDLFDYNIKAELTSTTRTGWSRFTFPDYQERHILYDFSFQAEEKTEILSINVMKASDHSIEGSIRQKGNYPGEYTVYFVSEFSEPIISMNGWVTEKYTGSDNSYGTGWRDKQIVSKNINQFNKNSACGIYLDFSSNGSSAVTTRTAISFVSIEQARINMNAEAYPFHWDFDSVVKAAAKQWNELLGRVEVEGREEDISLFYTCLYRCFTGKSILSDANGKYIDMCEKVQQLPDTSAFMLSADGSWGTQWDLSPLWTLLTPEYASAIIKSYIEFYDKGGWMPDSPTGLEYAPIMGAQHHKSLVVSSYQKGIRDFDVTKAWDAVKHDLTNQGIEHPCGGFAGNRQLNVYEKYGYVPDEDGAASNTLEYSFDDWCAAQFAKALKHERDYEFFLKRSMNYKNQFDGSTKFMRRRLRNRSFVEPFDEFAFGTQGSWNGAGFMEGNAWIYTYFVPHDMNGIIKLVGRDLFTSRLKDGFDNGHVDMGNQPNMQAPFLFNYAGEPWNTQKYSRKVTSSYISLSPLQGWGGEEDEGQLSALYVLLSMGIFEMDGGCSLKPYYDIGSPVLNHIKIHLSKKYYGGKTFEIIVRNNSSQNIYIQNAKLNGIPLTHAKITHEDLVKGGELELDMGGTPNYTWGK